MKQGIYLSLLTAVISGISIYANSVFVTTLNPVLFAVVRNSMVVLLCTALLFITGTSRHLEGLTRRDWLKLIVIGAIGGGIPFALFFSGIAQIGGVNGNIIQKTLFLWVALFAIPILHERIRAVQFGGYILLITGMFVFGGTAVVVPKLGTWMVLAATILWAIEQVVVKVTLTRVHPLVVAWGRIMFGLPFLIGGAMIMGQLNVPKMLSAFISVQVLVSSVFLVIYMTTWYHALSKAPATLVSSILVIAPVVTALINGVVSHKPVIYDQRISIILLLSGVVVMIAEKAFIRKKPAV